MDSICCAVIPVNQWELSEVLDIINTIHVHILITPIGTYCFLLSVDKFIYYRQNI